MASQQFCLKWNNHTNNMLTIFKDLLQMEIFVDVTLACDGLSIKAHKMVLSACSDFFRSLFIENPCKHPVIILKDVSYKDLKAIVDFMYHGEVNVSQDQLSALLKTAETLKVKGLAEVNAENQQSSEPAPQPVLHTPVVPAIASIPTSHRSQQQRRADSPPIHGRHKRVRSRKRSHSGSDQSDAEIVPIKIKEAHSPEIEEVQDSNISQMSHSSVNIRSSAVHSRSSPSFEESEYDVEPSKLLEQTLSSGDTPSMSKAGSSGGMQISGMGGDSQALVPTSDSSQFQELDISQDIKPEISFDEQSLSPSGYMDQSSLPGPSGYQDNSLVPQDSQSQAVFTISIIEKADDDKLRTIDRNVKNKFRWEWMDKKVVLKLTKFEMSVTLSDSFRKIDVPGKALCILCNDQIYYGGRGWNSFLSHLNSKKHLKIVETMF